VNPPPPAPRRVRKIPTIECVRVWPSNSPVTADDLLEGRAPSDHSELWDGTLLVGEPSAGWAGYVGTNVAFSLERHVRERRLGWVFPAEQGFLLRRNPDRVLAPDIAFVRADRLPEIPEAHFIPLAPDFLVEVRSSHDSWIGTIEKCGRWIAHGVPVVWAIDPRKRVVAVFRPLASPVLVGLDGIVDAAPALPDFRMPVREVFRGLVAPV